MNRRRSEMGLGEERSKREEREDRILDAAAGLITRWGYSKTTIDDIARQAGVAKGRSICIGSRGMICSGRC